MKTSHTAPLEVLARKAPGVFLTEPYTRGGQKRLDSCGHANYACISFVDAQVGRLLNELDRLGLRDNTLSSFGAIMATISEIRAAGANGRL